MSLEQILAEAASYSLWELTAVTLAIAYLILAVRENIACWYAAFVSTAIFLGIFWQVSLYMESALQVYYLAMAVYGWYAWQHADDVVKPLPISTWSVRTHCLVIGMIFLATGASGYLLGQNTDARLPYLDSFTTWGAVVTTFMVARKILENWLYWLVIDAVSIYLFLDRELYFTALLFAVYIVIIFFGYHQWLQHFRAQSKLTLAAG